MGTIYKITDRVWAMTSLPWPIFGIVWIGTILRLIIGTFIICLVIPAFPFMYLYGIYKWKKTKQCPDWFYPFWYSALFGWYIFLICWKVLKWL